jgi:GT2 family glycosyltransferase
VRGFPTLWRLATEYFFLRKLAPRTSVLNAFYGGGFAHDEAREVEVVMGACMLLRREAIAEVGPCDEDYFLFSEETDWCYRFRQAGWEVVFFPGAECTHVRGAAHGGRMYRENLRGHLLFLTKHRGPRTAERGRRLLLASLRLRAVAFRGERGRAYREGAAWLASADAAALVAARR